MPDDGQRKINEPKALSGLSQTSVLSVQGDRIDRISREMICRAAPGIPVIAPGQLIT